MALLAQDAAAHPGAAPFPLYDFSAYGAITTEPVPAPGSRAEMRYYWDSSHFKELVGDWVLDRMFGTANPQRPLPPDFGVLLTAQNLEAELARNRAARSAYRARHGAEIATLEGWVAEALAGGGGAARTSSASAAPSAAQVPSHGG